MTQSRSCRIHDKVLWLYVAMNDASGFEIVRRAKHLTGDIRESRPRELPVSLKNSPNGFPFHVLLDDENAILPNVHHTGGHDAGHVVAGELRGGFDLSCGSLWIYSRLDELQDHRRSIRQVGEHHFLLTARRRE
jgi:hypothetical protein